jgi:hypothetical protein
MFMRWRTWLAAQAGIPLPLMKGFYKWTWGEDDLSFERDYQVIVGDRRDRGYCWWETLSGFEALGRPIPFEVMNGDPLAILLSHSDCDGRIKWFDCKRLAIRLGKILRSATDDTKYPVYSEGPKAGEFLWTDWREGRSCYDGMVPATKRFIVGLLKAWHARQDVKFR